MSDNFPNWKAVNYYFNKWRWDGTLVNSNIGLNMLRRIEAGKAADSTLFCLDSQSIKAAPMISKDRGIDGNKRVNGRKRQTLVDTIGQVWGVLVHAANGSDTIYGSVLILEVKDFLKDVKKVLVDRGYDGLFLETCKTTLRIDAEISSKQPSEKGFVPVKWRWVSERAFGGFNFFRRLSKDYERTVQNSEAWILGINCQINISKL